MSDAAAEMLRRGVQPTVSEAAAAAGVHRATAYRYFPDARSLVAEAVIAVADIDTAKTLAGVPTDDPFRIIDTAVIAVCKLMFGEESLFRRNLLVALEGWFARTQAGDVDDFPSRSTRRFQWIDPAIEPLAATLGPDQLRRLRYALALSFGAEAVVVTRDVCRLGPEEATAVMRWTAASLIRAALAEAHPEPPGAS